MKALVQRKRIIVPYNGYIALKGIRGPIDIPYMETFENIGKLLMARIPVQEVLADGTTIPLTMINLDQENSWNTSSTQTKYEAVTVVNGEFVPVKKKINPTIVVTDEDVEAKSMEAILDASTKQAPAQTPTYVSGKKHKKDKYNRPDDEMIEVK